MPYSKLQNLWEGTKISDVVPACRALKPQEKMDFLQVLNLSGCVEAKSFPKGRPPNIKELYLNGTGIREIPASIEALSCSKAGRWELHKAYGFSCSAQSFRPFGSRASLRL
ncbi:unnamed protein product [Arabis nemorensis]|uniref:Uncharacterized protein n=1 Tax=Arabis nemorensis TaxID=586526 RepID=A0A565C5B3_9BRAS|nr:unnamed protein product [Arabis nemorensis]